MIISHKHRYLFIEIPVTGSWAIGQELVENYDGEHILHKHATYPEFESIATENETQFYVVATVRNPLDVAVSAYLKMSGDHKGIYSGSEAAVKEHKIDYVDKMAYEKYKEQGYSFEDVFLSDMIWERPFSGMIDVSARDIDFVIRYEQIQDDFAKFLRLNGLNQVRPIPVTNKTKGKDKSWESMYSPDIIPKVKRIYGPYMKRWGYKFPASWGGYEHSRLDDMGYWTSYIMKRLYLVHIKWKDNNGSDLIRRLNGIMKQKLYR